MEIEWVPKEHANEKIIYNPLDDPVMKKKRETHLKKLNRDLLQIKITVVAVTIISVILIYFAVKVNEMGIALMALMAMIAVIAGVFAGVLQSKGIYKIKMKEIVLLENGILYHRYYGRNNIPNPLYVSYKNIEDISIEIRPNSNKKRLITLSLDDNTPYKKEIEMQDAAVILEETVPDIDLFYDLLKEQVEKAKQKVESKELK